MPSLTWDAVNLDSDSLTGEDSLIDCSLLSNPTTDLLEEFAPIAISAPAHQGKCFPFLGSTCLITKELNNSSEFSLLRKSSLTTCLGRKLEVFPFSHWVIIPLQIFLFCFAPHQVVLRVHFPLLLGGHVVPEIKSGVFLHETHAPAL